MLATYYITSLPIIVYYLLQYTLLNEYICGQWRRKGGEVEYTPLGAGGGAFQHTHCTV